MSRARTAVLSSSLIVVAGLAVALGVRLLDSARAAVGPLPPAALAFPAETRFLVGIDVQRVKASPLFRELAGHAGDRPGPLAEWERQSGLSLERDVDQVVAGGVGADSEAKGEGVVLVLGRFDAARIDEALRATRGRVDSRDYRGFRLYVFDKTPGGAEAGADTKAEGGAAGGDRGPDAARPPLARWTGAFGVVDAGSLVFGSVSAVEKTLDGRAGESEPLRSNAALMALLEQVAPDSSFWLAGDRSVLAGMRRAVPGGPAAGEPKGRAGIPGIESLVVSGNLDPDVAVSITGAAADPAAAGQLADMIRGFVALATLQAEARPELRDLASAVSVTTEANRVHLEARLPYALIEALRPKKKEAAPDGGGAPERSVPSR
jgi:hypothetical protein